MRFERQKVIAQLLVDRSEFSRTYGRYVVACEADGLVLPGYVRDSAFGKPVAADYVNHCRHLAADAHEAIIKRSAVQGNDELIIAITETPFNLALLCHPCHMAWGQTSHMRAYLTRKLITRYGADPIIEWIDSLPWHERAEHSRFVLQTAKEMTA